MLDEGVHFQMGNLGREWEEKVTPTGKTVYENALAVSESKDSETFWVTLNVWEDSRDNSIALPEAVAKATGKEKRRVYGYLLGLQRVGFSFDNPTRFYFKLESWRNPSRRHDRR